MLFNRLPKFHIVDVFQDENRLDDFAEFLQRFVEWVLIGVRIETLEELGCSCFLELDGSWERSVKWCQFRSARGCQFGPNVGVFGSRRIAIPIPARHFFRGNMRFGFLS